MDTGVENNCRYVMGFHKNGIKAKVYEKTTRRARAEICIEYKSLRALKIDTNLSNYDTFEMFINHLVDAVVPIFSTFLRPIEADADRLDRLYPIEALAAIVSGCRPPNAAAFVNRLLHTGRLPATFARSRRTTLMRLGIIERSNRGVYRLVPAYQHAMEQLIDADASLAAAT